MEKTYAEQPWRKLQELVCLPETLEYPLATYTDYHLYRPAKKYPDNLAIVYMDREMTFRELQDQVDRFATALSDIGIKKGDVVATAMVSSIQFVVADLAIPRTGAIHAPMSILDSVDDLAGKFSLVKPEMVICTHTNTQERDILDKVKKAAKKTGVKNIIVTKAQDYSLYPPVHEAEKGITWFTDLIHTYPPEPPEVAIDVNKDTAMVIFTGGTTGTPKACMYPHLSLIGTAVNTSGTLMPPYLISLLEGLSRVIVPLPLFHILGHHGAIQQLSHAWTILLQNDPRDYKEYMRLVKKYHPTLNIGVPNQFMQLARQEGAEDLGLTGISSGAPLHQDTGRKFSEKTKSAIGQVYGPTEVGGTATLVSLADLALPALGSYKAVGRVFRVLDTGMKLPGLLKLLRALLQRIGPERLGKMTANFTRKGASKAAKKDSAEKRKTAGSIGIVNVDCEIKIIDLISGEILPISRVVKENLRGELWVKGPGRMSGFWPEPGSGIDEEGFVATGDVATVDETGHVYIVDRAKDMALVGGFNVYTGEIDKLLATYPGVDEAATIGIPDPQKPGSETIKVFIVPMPGHEKTIKEHEVIEYLNDKVAPYAVPRSVEFRGKDELPRTSAGLDKISKRILKEQESQKIKKA